MTSQYRVVQHNPPEIGATGTEYEFTVEKRVLKKGWLFYKWTFWNFNSYAHTLEKAKNKIEQDKKDDIIKARGKISTVVYETD